MAAGVRRIEFRAGHVLFNEGDVSKDLYVMAGGKVEITAGGEHIAYITDPGSYIGEMSFLLNQPRSATATVLEPSVVLVLGEDTLEKTIMASPDYAIKLAKSLASRLDRQNKLVQEFLKAHANQHKGNSLEAFVESLPFSKAEDILTEAVRYSIFRKGSDFTLESAKIRFTHFVEAVQDLRKSQDLTVKPLERLADEYGVGRDYQERLNRIYKQAQEASPAP